MKQKLSNLVVHLHHSNKEPSILFCSILFLLFSSVLFSVNQPGQPSLTLNQPLGGGLFLQLVFILS